MEFVVCDGPNGLTKALAELLTEAAMKRWERRHRRPMDDSARAAARGDQTANRRINMDLLGDLEKATAKFAA